MHQTIYQTYHLHLAAQKQERHRPGQFGSLYTLGSPKPCPEMQENLPATKKYRGAYLKALARSSLPGSIFCSNIEPKVHHIPVSNDVILSLQPQLPRFFRALLAFAGDVVRIGNDFGADEAALEVGVDRPRGLRRRGADGYSPGAHFLRSGGEEGLQAEQRVPGTDQAVQARFLQSHVGEK